MNALIALTGGIGSGKSTVASLLRNHGARTIDADDIARECLTDPAILDSLRAVAPDGFNPDGTLDRARFADRIFADADVRRSIESIMHPWIRQRMTQLSHEADVDGFAVVVQEIPLLIENRSPAEIAADFDGVICVEADESVRLQRLIKRGMNEDDARARMAAQASPAARGHVATWVVDNNDDVDTGQLAERVAEVWFSITQKLQESQR